MDDMYKRVLRDLSKGADVTASMGKTKELWGYSFRLSNPRDRIVYNPVRVFNIYQAVGWWIWMISGRSDFNFINYYNINAPQFSYDLRQIEGAYGPRLFGAGAFRQIPRIIEGLQKKASSRRTVAVVFDAAHDNRERDTVVGPDGRKRAGEIPCTLSLQFLLRGGKVNCITTMRSQDAYGLLPQDVFHFTMFQELVAASVKAEVGEYLHQAGSFHYYPDRVKMFDETINAAVPDRGQMPSMIQGDQQERMRGAIALEERIRVNAIEVQAQAKKYGANDLIEYLREAKKLGPFWEDLIQACLVWALMHSKAFDRLEQLIPQVNKWLLPFARVSLKMKTGQQFLDNYAFSTSPLEAPAP